MMEHSRPVVRCTTGERNEAVIGSDLSNGRSSGYPLARRLATSLPGREASQPRREVVRGLGEPSSRGNVVGFEAVPRACNEVHLRPEGRTSTALVGSTYESSST
jgi:hypothetical protein